MGQAPRRSGSSSRSSKAVSTQGAEAHARASAEGPWLASEALRLLQVSGLFICTTHSLPGASAEGSGEQSTATGGWFGHALHWSSSYEHEAEVDLLGS